MPARVLLVLVPAVLGLLVWAALVFLGEGEAPERELAELGRPTPRSSTPSGPATRALPPAPPVGEQRTELSLARPSPTPAPPPGPEGWSSWRVVGRVRGVREQAPWQSRIAVRVFQTEVPHFGPLLADRHAMAEVRPDGSYELALDDAGALFLRGATLELSADDPAYTPAKAELAIDPATAWNPRSLRLDLEVELATGLHGTVIGPDSRPVPEAGVALFEREGDAIAETAIAVARAGKDGAYLLRAPRAGNFLVVAFDPLPEPPPRRHWRGAPMRSLGDLLRSARGGSVQDPLRLRPSPSRDEDAPAPTVAVRSQLRPGARHCAGAPGVQTLVPAVQMMPGARIAGTVRLEGAGPLQGAVVQATLQQPRGSRLEAEGAPVMVYDHGQVEYVARPTTTDERGEWELLCLASAEEYELEVARMAGLALGRTLERATRRAVSPADSIHLILAGSIIDVKLRRGRGQAVAGDVRIDRRGRPRRTARVPEEGLSLLVEPGQEHTLDLDVPFMERERRVVTAPAAGETVVEVFQLRHSEAKGSLSVRVRAKGDPPAELSYRLDPADRELPTWTDTVTLDEDGRFLLEEVPLGAHRLHLFPAEHPGPSRDVPAESLFHPVAIPVELRERDGAPTEVSLTLRRAGALRVALRDPDEGTPVAAEVWIGLGPDVAKWLDGVDLFDVARHRGLHFDVGTETPRHVAPSLLPPGRYPVEIRRRGRVIDHEIVIERGEILDVVWDLRP